MTTSPNHGPSPHNLSPSRGPDYVDNLPDALQIDAVEKLRAEQVDHIDSLIQAAESSKGGPLEPTEEIAVRGQAMSEFDEEIKKYLERNSIDAADPQFDTYVTQLRELSVDKIDDLEWNNRPIDPNDSSNLLPSPRMKAVEDLRSLSTTITPAPANTLVIPKTPAEIKNIVKNNTEVVAAQAEVDKTRGELAEITARRQGRLFNSKETTKIYEEKQEAYHKAVNELAKAELKVERDEGLVRTEEGERLDATFKLMQEYQTLQRDTIKEMEGTKVHKFVEWMTSGGTAKRIMKGAVVGLSAGVIGAGLIAVTAGTGGGAAVAGSAAAVAMVKSSQFARGYARYDNAAGRGMEVIDANIPNSSYQQEALNETGAGSKTAEESVDVVHSYLMKKLDEETSREQGKRRKATMKALGGVALGVGIIEGAHYAADIISDYYDVSKMNDKMPWGKDNVEAKGDGNTGSGDGNEDAKNGGDGSGTSQESTSKFEGSEYADARSIENGEGFYQTFTDMDIPAEDHAALLDKVGPELQNQSLAYRMPNGEWGIRMTPDGKMPTEALDAIAKAHEQMNGTAGTSATETATDAAGDTPATKPEGIFFDSEPVAVDTSPATPESITDTVDRSAVGDVLAKGTINSSDVMNNSQLMELSHVSTWYPPEALGQKLHLPASEWNKVQDYITTQTEQNNRLYTNAFDVQNGYLKFTGNRIPADTMADILTHIPPTTRSRYGLTA